MEFKGWSKTPRLVPREGKPVVISEKLDGANVGVHIEIRPHGHFGLIDRLAQGAGLTVNETSAADVITVVQDFPMDVEYWIGAQSRSRMINPSEDMHGFARWVEDNAATLVADLGVGLHMGEWWGQGIRRGYGLAEKRLSLFNTRKWSTQEFVTPGLGVVPVLAESNYVFWSADVVRTADRLRMFGSEAVPGFMNPEGVCVYHPQADTVFKYTLDGDGHKGERLG